MKLPVSWREWASTGTATKEHGKGATAQWQGSRPQKMEQPSNGEIHNNGLLPWLNITLLHAVWVSILLHNSDLTLHKLDLSVKPDQYPPTGTPFKNNQNLW